MATILTIIYGIFYVKLLHIILFSCFHIPTSYPHCTGEVEG